MAKSVQFSVKQHRGGVTFSMNSKRVRATSKFWGVKKDGGAFDQFTGATITPRAVVNAIEMGLIKYAAIKENWLVPASEKL